MTCCLDNFLILQNIINLNCSILQEWNRASYQIFPNSFIKWYILVYFSQARSYTLWFVWVLCSSSFEHPKTITHHHQCRDDLNCQANTHHDESVHRLLCQFFSPLSLTHRCQTRRHHLARVPEPSTHKEGQSQTDSYKQIAFSRQKTATSISWATL